MATSDVRCRSRSASSLSVGGYEKGETQSFYNAFFDIFGVQRRKVATFGEPVRKLDGRHGFIDLFWKGVPLVERKSAGRSLARAQRARHEGRIVTDPVAGGFASLR